MKKFIALTIGLSFLGAAFLIPLSEASREAYHNYLTQKSQEDGSYRRSTDYKGNSQRVISAKKSTNILGRNYRKSLIARESKRNIYSSKPSNKNLRVRTSTNRLFGLKRATHNNSYWMAISTNNKLDASDFLFKNYSNDIFSLEVPIDSLLNDENNFLKATVPESSIKMTVEKLDSKCQSFFSICARSISRGIDRTNSTYRASKTIQQYQKTDSILGDMELNNKKFVEGFIGINEGKTFFIARFIVEGKNGDIFLAEVSSDLKDIDKTVIFAKKLFGTFRVKY